MKIFCVHCPNCRQTPPPPLQHLLVYPPGKMGEKKKQKNRNATTISAINFLSVVSGIFKCCWGRNLSRLAPPNSLPSLQNAPLRTDSVCGSALCSFQCQPQKAFSFFFDSFQLLSFWLLFLLLFSFFFFSLLLSLLLFRSLFPSCSCCCLLLCCNNFKCGFCVNLIKYLTAAKTWHPPCWQLGTPLAS